MDTRSVRAYVEQSQFVHESTQRLDTETTKAKLIHPLIDLLGWNLFDQSVKRNYTLEIPDGVVEVDYALFLDNTPVIVIGVLGAADSLDEGLPDQFGTVISTGSMIERGLLTNGREFHAYDTGNSDPFLRFSLDELSRNPGMLDLFSKPAIQSGKATSLRADLATIESTVGHVRQQQSQLADRVANVITEELGDDISLAVDAHAQAFVQDILTDLEIQRKFIHSPHIPSTEVAASDNTDLTSG